MDRQRLTQIAETGRLLAKKVGLARNYKLRTALETLDRLNPPASNQNFSRFSPPVTRESEEKLRNAAADLVEAMLEFDEWPSKPVSA